MIYIGAITRLHHKKGAFVPMEKDRQNTPFLENKGEKGLPGNTWGNAPKG